MLPSRALPTGDMWKRRIPIAAPPTPFPGITSIRQPRQRSHRRAQAAPSRGLKDSDPPSHSNRYSRQTSRTSTAYSSPLRPTDPAAFGRRKSLARRARRNADAPGDSPRAHPKLAAAVEARLLRLHNLAGLVVLAAGRDGLCEEFRPRVLGYDWVEDVCAKGGAVECVGGGGGGDCARWGCFWGVVCGGTVSVGLNCGSCCICCCG